MYLLNVESGMLEYFQNSSDVPYAILSHRWAQEEVSYQDVQNGSAATKYGHGKVVKACEQARKSGLAYVWIDTCCIDKTSSAELSEAINSMFNWYSGAQVCYAYLADVPDHGSIRYSAWFTRGWTLQELIAPATMEFFTSGWVMIGTKSSLVDELSLITSVPVPILVGNEKLRQHSVAERMSWAARRTTTRLEDRAYSLMGIFEITMPLLYGEGARAFIRLQEEIIKQTDDHTIFAWHSTGNISESDGSPSGLLAKSVDAFANCSHLARRTPALELSTFSITNRGLSIRLPLLQWSYTDKVAFLNCVERNPGPAATELTVGIFVRQLEEPGQYARTVLKGQDRILCTGGCFNGDEMFLERDWRHTNSAFTLGASGTYKGPIIYGPSVYGKQGQVPDFKRLTEDVYFRQDPLDFGRLTTRRMFGFRFRRFTPYQKDADFDYKGDFSIRCWNDWSHHERYALIPTGMLGDACWVHVKKKKVKRLTESARSRQVIADSKTENAASSWTTKVLPSLLLLLGFTKNDEMQLKVGLASNPSQRDVAAIMDDWRPDAHVLGNPLYAQGGGFPGYIKTYDHTPIVQESDGDRVHMIFVTSETIDGVEEKVVDLLWAGPESHCDECGKFLKYERQYCCVSCSSPQYDCCTDCFKKMPDTWHDLKPGRAKHSFRSVFLGRPHLNAVSQIPDENKHRLL